MEEKKVDLFESLNKLVFDIDSGYITQSLSCVSLNTDKSSYNAYHIYRLKNSKHVKITDLVDFVKTFNWKEKFYIRNDHYGYFGYSRVQKQNEYEEITVSSIALTISYKENKNFKNRNNNYGYNYSKSSVIKISNQEEFDKLFEKKYSLIIDESQINTCSPYVYEIKVGNCYWMDDLGKVTITKKYDYPNKDNKLFQAIGPNESIKDITTSNVCNLKFLPFDNIPNSKNSFLNNSLNEIELMPYLALNEKTYNLYWKKIDEASNYIVSIYKKVSNFGRIEYYHIANYDIDRDLAFFSINNLIVKNSETEFIFKLYAEDRKGDKIAESRGIVNGQPQFFEEVY